MTVNRAGLGRLLALAFALGVLASLTGVSVAAQAASVPAAQIKPLAEDAHYTPVGPARLADTRSGFATVDGSGPRGAVGSDSTVSVAVAGRGGVPTSGVAAVVVNVTAVQPSLTTFVTVFPTGTQRPVASNLNPIAGQTRANAVIATLGEDGSISIYNRNGAIDLVVDVLGWLAEPQPETASASQSTYRALEPIRLADTREGMDTIDGAGPKGAMAPDSVTRVQLEGRAGITDAVGVVVNVTAVKPSAGSYLTVYPTGETQPTASNLNPVKDETTPNLVIATLGADGSISVYNRSGEAHLIVDVLGYFVAGGQYEPLIPGRLADTREGSTTVDGGGPRGASGPDSTVRVQVAGRGGVPSSGVAAVVVNVTAVRPTSQTFLTVFPTGTARPVASNLNPPACRQAWAQRLMTRHSRAQQTRSTPA